MEREHPAFDLAQRLRALRRDHWPDVRITQPELGHALGRGRDLSVSLISSWESPHNAVLPPLKRLEDYATLFCTRRSLEGGALTLLDPLQLTPGEREERDRLRTELLRLRAAAMGEAIHESAISQSNEPEAADLWRFPDGDRITIICAPLPEDKLAGMPYVSPEDPDYIELYTFADLDALVELWGHLRAVNPHVRVIFKVTRKVARDDLTTHLVLLGGVDWNDLTTDMLNRLGLPVRQVTSWEQGVLPYFEAGGERFMPTLHKERLTDDVALFYRGPNPYNRERTVTICNGMYGRGTYGAVRTLTDERFRERNAAYLRTHCAEDGAFGILCKVSVVNGETLTPDWATGQSRLYTWPQGTP